MIHTYSISTDTLNAKADSYALEKQVNSADITIAVDYITIATDVLTIAFKATLSAPEISLLDAVVSAHNGDPVIEIEQIEVTSSQPFAAKTLTNGKRLYAREHGVTGVTIAAGQTGTLVFEVPYAAVKVTGAQILGCKVGDTVDFKILDTDAGLLTTVPLYPINQFGYNVNMPADEYRKQYNYDADLFAGLHISAEYTNNGTESVTVSMNLDLHEVKD